jgi:RNA polymerase sigma-70 factor, ECF subfamily
MTGDPDPPGPGVSARKRGDCVSLDDPMSSSLLRKAAARQPDAWQRLMGLYSPLVAHWCRQAGLNPDDRQDVMQDVFSAVAAGLPSFRPDQGGATFRSWLRGIARHKIQDHFRHRPEPAPGGTDAQRRLQEVPGPDPEVELSESHDEVTELYHRALELVRSEFEERTWSAFWQVAVENRTTAEVAAQMGITINAVRQAKSRVLRRLKEEMGELIT